MDGHGTGGARGRRGRHRVALAAALAVLLVALATPWAGLGAAPAEPLPALADEEAASLEARYGPVLKFSSAERTLPMSVEHFIANSRLIAPSGEVDEDPAPEDLGPGTEGYSLDHEGGDQGDEGAIATYELEGGADEPTVYVRTAEAERQVLIQYWLFYVFNQGRFNAHEGDWELVQVILDRATLAPSSLTVSRHFTSDRAPWEDLESEDLDGTHPVVLVAAGSHANYLPSSLLRYPGDRAGGDGEVIVPGDYELVRIGQAVEGEVTPSWLLYEGTWGEAAATGYLSGARGPPGPMYRMGGQMWAGLEWGA